MWRVWHVPPKEGGFRRLTSSELNQREEGFLMKVGYIRFTDSRIQDPEPSALESSPVPGDVKTNSLGSIRGGRSLWLLVWNDGGGVLNHMRKDLGLYSEDITLSNQVLLP